VLPLATKLAQFCDAEVVAAHVIRRPEMARRTPPTDEDVQLIMQVEERNRQETLGYFEQLRARLTRVAETLVVSGESAASALHELAERIRTDLVILSAHGFTGAMRWPYGSVAQSFVWGSAVPVFIVDDSGPCPPIPEQEVTTVPRSHEVPAHA
jgi:nucleotide-binding universal stress UspA family protein